MPGDLDGLGAAVTGGGSGIGLATAWLLGIVRATRAAVPHIRRSPGPGDRLPGQPAGPLHDRHRPDHRPRRAGAAPAGGPEVMSVPGALDILPLGGSGLQVSRLGLGTAPLGNLFTEVLESDADATIDAALGAGVTFVDTAPHYGLGVAERRLGRRLARVPRDRFVLSTKVGRLVRPLEAGEMADPEGFTATPRAKRVWDFSRDGVRRSLDESLDRLGLDRIDVALVHDPDNHEREAAEHALPALAELRDQGVVRAIGAGMNQAEMLTRFVRELDLDLVLMAGRYSLLDQGALTELLPACVERGVAVVIGGVFNSGLLADPRPGATFDYAPAPPELFERAGRLQAVCTRHGVPLRAVALAFPFGHPAVASVLVGARTAAEVQDAVVMLGRSVPAELWAELVADGLLPGHVPVPTS